MIMNISKHIEDNQILSIVGPTASGKSALALELAQVYIKLHPRATIHLLSADSRQVYQGLTTLTGADIPNDWSACQIPSLGYLSFKAPEQAIYLHAVAIIHPTAEWSAAHFRALFTNLQSSLQPTDRLIVVGGTGFYHGQLMHPTTSLHIPPNPQLRLELEQLSLQELQEQLKQSNPNRWQTMNHSDQQNPRRLIRALEIAGSPSTQPQASFSNHEQPGWPVIYLDLPLSQVRAAITARVLVRLDEALQEVTKLLKQIPTENDLDRYPAYTSTGFQQLAAVIKGKIDQATAIADWTTTECQYAKRQITWWKKQQHLIKIKPEIHQSK